MPRPIDADAVLYEINELKKSPWYNGGENNYERLVRSDAVGIVVDLCIKQAHTIDYVPRHQWISVKDRLPDTNHVMLVCTRNRNNIPKIAMAYYENGFGWCGNGGRWNNITHWMPLPEPPKEE